MKINRKQFLLNKYIELESHDGRLFDANAVVGTAVLAVPTVVYTLWVVGTLLHLAGF